jgi:hypothetical protein
VLQHARLLHPHKYSYCLQMRPLLLRKPSLLSDPTALLLINAAVD